MTQMRVAINSYSLRNDWDALVKSFGSRDEALARLCSDLDISAVELLDRDVNTEKFSDQLKFYQDRGIEIFSLAPHVKTLVKPDKVKEELEDAEKWMKLAQMGGIKKLRFQIGNGPLMRLFPPMDDFDEEEWNDYYEQVDDAIEMSALMIDPLLELAEKYDVFIGMETHHSYSSNYIYMNKFNQRWDKESGNNKRIGWIFDIGNYENDEMRWKGLNEIKDRTLYIHAKAYSFNDNDGLETTLDYQRAARVLSESGFGGEWSIEWEGKMNGIAGVYCTNELIKYALAGLKNESYSIQRLGHELPAESELLSRYCN